ncbi:MAG TPA: lipid-A-disaccharide synthase [Steroidobacteraceae bacterium]|nr:lipid-A-disaccharide synthase [Steroidobacteraceae bacterium]
MSAPVRLALVAGEHSGDQLGAGLIRELRARLPGAEFFGVAGPRMTAAGCAPWASSERLAVMGLFEVVRHLPDLMKLRGEITRRFIEARPDVFVGVDAPEFNLGLARRLREAGIRTVQYVSPQVWAWRSGRVRGIARSVDSVLCLLPFEVDFYRNAGVHAEFVGHPLADQIPLSPDRASARTRLGLTERPTVAVLPGSRMGEVSRLGEVFAQTIAWLNERRPDLQFVAPMASRPVREKFELALQRHAAAIPVRLADGDAQTALAAADAVIVASGTATLETLLSKRPMVVAYRLGALTAWLVRTFNLMKAPYFSQPNLLAGRLVVREFFQEAVTPEALGSEIVRLLDDAAGRAEIERLFTEIHHRMRQGASERAAQAVMSLLPGAGRAGQ